MTTTSSQKPLGGHLSAEAPQRELLRSLSIAREARSPVRETPKRALDAKRPSLKHLWQGAGAAVIFIGLSASAWYIHSETSRAGPANRSNPAVADPVASPITGVLIASGFVVAERQTTVSALETGRVAELLVEVGDRVSRGDVLARLDSSLIEMNDRVYEAQIAAARAGSNVAATQLEIAEGEVGRAQTLYDKGFLSPAALEARDAEMEMHRSRLQQEQATARAVSANRDREREVLDRYTVRAPFDGVISVKNAQIGETVSPVSAGGGFTRTGIYTIVDMASLQIEVRIAEDRAVRTAVGDSVTVSFDAFPGREFAGSVSRMVPLVDRDRGTVPVQVVLDQPLEGLLPNMASKVRFRE